MEMVMKLRANLPTGGARPMTSTPTVRIEPTNARTAVMRSLRENRSAQRLGLIIAAFILFLFGLQRSASAQCTPFQVGEYNVQFDWQGSAAWSAESGVSPYLISLDVNAGCPPPAVTLSQPDVWPVYEPPLITIGAPYFVGTSGLSDLYYIPLTIEVNPYPSYEIGTITLQEGATSSVAQSCESFTGDDPNPCYITVGDGPNPGCSYKVTPTSTVTPTSPTSYGLKGGPGGFNVVATPNSGVSLSACTWSAASGNSWITNVSPSSGAGNGNVTYSVSPLSAGSQSGTIAIAGQVFSISQGSCSVTLPNTWLQGNFKATKYDNSFLVDTSDLSFPITTPLTLTDGINSCSIPASVSAPLTNPEGIANEENCKYVNTYYSSSASQLSAYDIGCQGANCYNHELILPDPSDPNSNVLTPKSFGAKGCAVTSLAMSLSYAGVVNIYSSPTSETPLVSLDPGQLNNYMANTLNGLSSLGGSFDGEGGVQFDKTVGSIALNSDLPLTWNSPGGIAYLNANPNNTAAFNALNNALCNLNAPIIVGVPSYNKGKPTPTKQNGNFVPGHYVVVTGRTGTDPNNSTVSRYLISDPAGNATYLDQYGDNFITRGSVINSSAPAAASLRMESAKILSSTASATSATDLSGLDIVADDSADVMVVDPIGNYSGFNPAAGVSGENIQNSAYFVDTIVDDDTGDQDDGITHSVHISTPQIGDYQVTLTGINQSPFTLTMTPYSTDGSAQGPVSVTGTLAPGATAQYQVAYNSTPGSTPVITPVVPPVTTTPAFISFPSQGLGSSSAAQTVTLSNTGSVVVNLSSIGVAALNSGDFSETNNCGATIAVGANCAISVMFTPVAAGAQIGAVVIADGASNSPQLVGLNGTATAGTPAVTVTPIPPSITTAQALSVTVAVNGGSGSATPTGSVTLSGGGYTSTATTLSGGSATINIPAGSLATGIDTLTASYSGDSNYNATTGASQVTVTVPPPPGFTISGTVVSMSPGASAGNSSMITVTPVSGFTGNIALTAAITSSPSGAQNPPTLSFGSTSPVSITGVTSGTATLTISTTAATSAALTHPKRPAARWYATGGATLACLLLFGIPARWRRWRTMLGMLMFLVALAGGVLSCGGSGSGGGGGGGNGGGGGGGGTSNPGTTAGNYTVTITGTSGTITNTGTVALTVE
jgi:Bacterial Ig-like domain (group 3)